MRSSVRNHNLLAIFLQAEQMSDTHTASGDFTNFFSVLLLLAWRLFKSQDVGSRVTMCHCIIWGRFTFYHVVSVHTVQ